MPGARSVRNMRTLPWGSYHQCMSSGYSSIGVSADMRMAADLAARVINTPGFRAAQRMVAQTVAPQMAGVAAQISRSMFSKITGGIDTTQGFRDAHRMLARSFEPPRQMASIAAHLSPSVSPGMHAGIISASGLLAAHRAVELAVAPSVAARLSQAMCPTVSRLWKTIAPHRSWIPGTGLGFGTVLDKVSRAGAAISRWLQRLRGRPKPSMNGQPQLAAGLRRFQDRVRRLQEAVGIRHRVSRRDRVCSPPGHGVAARPQLTRGPNRRLITYFDQPAGTSLRAA